MAPDYLEDLLGQQASEIVIRLVLAVIVLALTWLVREIITAIVPRLVHRLLRQTRITWDASIVQALRPPVRFLITVGGLWIAVLVLDLPADARSTLGDVKDALVAVGLFWGLYRLVEPVMELVWGVTRRTMHETALPTLLDQRLATALNQIVKALLIVLAFAAVLDAWGYNVGGLVAGLGIGGLAVALAAQDVLANLFGYFVILADEPFRIGEYVVFDGISGTVETIGFRSARIRALDQSLITVPNKTIMNASIVNWSRLAKRRLNMTLGIQYGNSPEQVLSVVQAIREMLKAHELVESDSVVVQFVEFNQSSLDLMIICFMKTPAWGDFQAARQDINLKIMNILAERGVELAFPSHTVYIERAAHAAEVAARPALFPPPVPEPTASTATDSPVPDDAAN